MLRRRSGRPILPAGLTAFFLTQLLTLTPVFSPAAVYRPQLLLSPIGGLILIGLALAGGLLLQTLSLLIRVAAGNHQTWGRRTSVGIVTLLVLTFQGATAYYTRFGSYPNAGLLRDFLDAPGAFLAYTASDVGTVDTVTFLLAAAGVIGLAIRGTRQVWDATRPWAGAIGAAVAGVLLLVAIRALPVSKQHAFFVSEHSLPAIKYVLSAARSAGGNGVESFRPLVPRAVSEPAAGSRPRARHVVLIVAEALRADHLPAYGYRRDTTPFITTDPGRWLVFQRAYAHGSRTADSVPVIFNSRYLAAVDRTNRGAVDLWASLRAADVRTAFLSAGAIEWGGVRASIAFENIDEGLIASDFPQQERRGTGRLPFDYAVDDALPVDKYSALMRGAFGQGSSFATLHLVGSHYPFDYADTENAFVPNLREHGRAGRDDTTVRLQQYDVEANLSGGRLTEIANSYDNGIRHIDRMVRRVVETLEGLGLLEDTVIIVTSDHGEALGEHRTLFHGTTLYEEQVHVPLLIRVGAHLGPIAAALNTRSGDVAGLVDLMPTVHDLVTGGAPPPAAFEGVSWLRTGRKPYELLLFRGIGEMAGIATRDRKYLFDVSGRRAEEYDLAVDPAERNNLWQGGEETVAQFIDALRRRGAVRSHATHRASHVSDWNPDRQPPPWIVDPHVSEHMANATTDFDAVPR